MTSSRIQMAAWGIFAASVLVVLPGLASQWEQSRQLRAALAGRDAAERAGLLDNPAFDAAHEIASVVAADGCVTVLAYAGPDALTYYNARFDYLLYPREVRVVADSGANFDECGFLAVLRDTPANLAASPFSGEWDDDALAVRLAGLDLALQGAKVEVFETR